jgi:hypothetical protein
MWAFTPTNKDAPRIGFFPSSHQLFSNHALQVALYLYNSINEQGVCVGVSHCLYLSFTKKVDGIYLLNNDRGRIAFNLDLGLAGELYSLVQGEVDDFTYRVVRSGKAPKSIIASVQFKGGRRVVTLAADTSNEGRQVRVEVDLDRSAQIVIAAHCIAYGRLLYPSLGDGAVQSLLSTPGAKSRACARNSDEPSMQLSPVDREISSAPNLGSDMAVSLNVGRLRNAIWAIGNQKWASMQLEPLKRIQALTDASKLKAMIDAANSGDFSSWDAFLT